MKIRQLVESYGKDIDLSYNSITVLPSDLPQHVIGSFDCSHNILVSLSGCPVTIDGNFYCHHNKITSLSGSPSKTNNMWCDYNQLESLEGCTSYVSGSFFCQNNKLSSLEGCPSQVGGNFWCHKNKLTSLHNVHKHISNIGGNFVCKNNMIRSHILGSMMVEIGGEIITRLGNGTDVDEVLNKWKNQGRRGVMGAMKELMDLGYEELAQL